MAFSDHLCFGMAFVYSFFGVTLAISPYTFWGPESPLCYWTVMDEVGLAAVAAPAPAPAPGRLNLSNRSGPGGRRLRGGVQAQAAVHSSDSVVRRVARLATRPRRAGCSSARPWGS